MRHIGTPPTPVAQLPRTARRVARRTRPRLDWGAVGAGLAIAAAIQMALALFGRALVLGAGMAPDRAASGPVAALWGSAVLVISLYVGGSATGRIAGARTVGSGTLHGVVLWAVSTLLAAWLATSGAPSIVDAALGVRGTIGSAVVDQTAAGVWLALLGLGVGLTAAVGGTRGWLRRWAPPGMTGGGRHRSTAELRAVRASARPSAGTSTRPDDSPARADRQRAPTFQE